MITTIIIGNLLILFALGVTFYVIKDSGEKTFRNFAVGFVIGLILPTWFLLGFLFRQLDNLVKWLDENLD